jgi:hypothetical protein
MSTSNITTASSAANQHSPKYRYNPVSTLSPGIELHEMPDVRLELQDDPTRQTRIMTPKPERAASLLSTPTKDEIELVYVHPKRQQQPDNGAGVGIGIDIAPSPTEKLAIDTHMARRVDPDEFDEKYPNRLVTVPLTPPPSQEHRIDITEDQAQAPQQPVASAQHEDQEKATCGAGFSKAMGKLFNCLNPARAYREHKQAKQVRKQAKAVRKQAQQEKLARKAAYEKGLREYYTAMQALTHKLFGQDAHLTILPDSHQRRENEILAGRDRDDNRYPVFEREADLTAKGKQYHVHLTEMRKADPEKPTKHAYMWPTDQEPFVRTDIREREPSSRYANHTIMAFNLTGPAQEKLDYKLGYHPNALWVRANYTEEGGKPHERNYAYLKGSHEVRDIRPGDGQIQVLTKSIRSAMNRAEIQGVIDKHIENAQERQRIKGKIDAAYVYNPPQPAPMQGRQSKKQKKQAQEQQAAAKTAFLERRGKVESGIQQTLAATKAGEQRAALLELVNTLNQ